MQTIMDLGKKLKKKYPGQFDSIPDAELGRQLKSDYPGEYDDYVDQPIVSEKKKETNPQSLPSKLIKGSLAGLGYTGSQTTKKAYAPIAEMFANEESKAKLKALEGSKETVFPSDVTDVLTEQYFPGALDIAKLTPLGQVSAATGRIAIDAALDPLSYVGLGTTTKFGRIAKLIEEAGRTKEPIRLGSKLAKESAAYLGKSGASPQVIKDIKTLVAQTSASNKLSSQVATGRKALLSFAGKAIPGTSGPIAAKLLAPFDAARKSLVGSKIDEGLRKLFSTQSGNPEFDELWNSSKDIIFHKTGLEIQEGKALNEKLIKISRETGIPREELNKQFNRIAEAITKPPSKAIYSKAVRAELLDHYQDKLVDAKLAAKAAHVRNDPVALDKASKDVAEYNSLINELTKTYKPPPSITPELDVIVKEQQARLANMLLREQTSGAPAVSLLADIGYLPHITTNEAREAITNKLLSEGKVLPRMGSKDFNEEIANYLHRQLNEVKPKVIQAWGDIGIIPKKSVKRLSKPDAAKDLFELVKDGTISPEQFNDAVHTLSLEEVNKLPQEVKEKIFGKDIGTKEIFHTDPVYATTIRGVRGVRAATSAEFYREMVAREIALPEMIQDATGKLIANPNVPDSYVNSIISELKGYKVPPEVADVLQRYTEISRKPTALRDFLRTYDKAQNLYKVWTLAPFPQYHTMNAVGNFWNNWLAGLTNPLRYGEAAAVRTGKKVEFKGVYGETWDTPRLYKRAQELGIVGHGQYAADIEQTLKQELESGKLLSVGRRNHLLRLGLRVGKEIEDNARMALFIDRLRKGDTAEQAAVIVKKFLFDYGDLSNIERNVFKRLFPFYTWTRKNIPLQLHALVTTPGKFMQPFRIKHEIEKGVPESPEKYLADWTQANFPIRIRYNAKNKTYEYFMLNRWLPAADIVKLANLHEIAAQSLTPFLKEPLQQLFNQDFYFHRKIKEIPGQKDILHFGPYEIKAPTRLVHATKTIRLLNEIDKMSKSDSDFYSKVLQILTGRTFTFDPQTAMQANVSRVNEDMKTLIRHYTKTAVTRPLDKEEKNRIRKLIKQKAKEY